MRVAGQWRELGAAQPVDNDGRVALPEFGGPAGLAELYAGEERPGDGRSPGL